MAPDVRWTAAERPTPASDRSAALCASLAVGLVVGLAAAGLAVRQNPSLREPGDATYALLGLGLVYALLFVPIGLVGLVLVRLLARVRKGEPRDPVEPAEPGEDDDPELQPGGRWPFSTHASVSLSGFAAYVLAQLLAMVLGAGGEHELVPLISSGAALLTGLTLAAFIVTRQQAQTLIGLWRWLLPMSLIFTGGVFLLVGLGSSEVIPEASGAEDDVLGGGERTYVRVDKALAQVPDPQRRRVVVIALDGADWRRIDALLQAGQLPSFERLIGRGVRAPLLSQAPAWPTIAWTTVATGVPPEVHGVRDVTEVVLPYFSRGVQRLYDKRGLSALLPPAIGLRPLVELLLDSGVLQERPVGSGQRMAKSVWNILAERGVPTAVVRWPASYPAESLNGWVVANDDPWTGDMVIQQAWDADGPEDELAWPPDLRYELADLIDRARDGRDFRLTLAGPGEPVGAEPPELPVFQSLNANDSARLKQDPRLAEEARLVLAADLFSVTTALRLWRLKQPDLLFMQMRCIDVLNHRCGEMQSVIDGAYRFLDQALGAWLEAAGSDTTFVLTSAYGWDDGADGAPRGHDHAPQGILVMGGSAVRAGVEFTDAPSIHDIAPTLLALYGLPPTVEMPGRALVEALRVGSRPTASERPNSYGPYFFRRQVPGALEPEQGEDAPEAGPQGAASADESGT